MFRQLIWVTGEGMPLYRFGDSPGGLNYRNGELWIENVKVHQLLRQHPTPVVVYSAARLRDNAQYCRLAFAEQIRIMFSYKACYLGGVLRTLHDEQIDAEVCSGREYRLARAIGLPPERISWNAVSMDAEELRLALSEGVAYLGINTRDDLERVAAAAQTYGRQIPIMLRIHPSGITSTYLSRGSRLGLDVTDGTAFEVVCAALTLPGITLRGFHCHTQVKQVEPQRLVATLHSVVAFAEHVYRETGYRVNALGIGGGLAGRSDMLHAGQDVALFGQAFTQALKRLSWPAELIIEPGRFFVDDAAIGLTHIISRTCAAGNIWWIVDLGTQFLVPFEQREFEVAVALPSDAHPIEVSIGDRLSSYSGVIKRNASLSAHPREDLLLIHAVGAYTFSTVQRFMYGMPEVLLVDGEQIEVLWHRETDEAWIEQILSAGGNPR